MSAIAAAPSAPYCKTWRRRHEVAVREIADELTVSPVDGGVIVRFPPGRPYRLYRAFRGHFPKARPVENWGWFVPGPTAARRVTLWQTRAREDAAAAARAARRAAQDLEWEAAAP
jgi:hypothetical protein